MDDFDLSDLLKDLNDDVADDALLLLNDDIVTSSDPIIPADISANKKIIEATLETKIKEKPDINNIPRYQTIITIGEYQYLMTSNSNVYSLIV